MATWTITVSAASNQGDGASGTTALTGGNAVPGDFDGGTITDVSVSGTPSVSCPTAPPKDDTIGVRFRVQTTGGTAVYGDNTSDAVSMCFATLAGAATSGTIADGSAPSPAPSTAVAADWDEVHYLINYANSGMPDGEQISWSAFDIVVTYTPGNVTIQVPTGSLTATGAAPTLQFPAAQGSCM